MKKNSSARLHRTIHMVHFGFTSGLIALLLFSTLSFAILSYNGRKHAAAAVSSFSSGSFWNSAVPTYVEQHPDSQALVGDILRQVNQFGASFSQDSESSPVYTVDSTVPTLAVQPWDCGNGIASGLAEQWQSVPIPFYAVPSSGANARMVIYQHGSGTVWEFGHMRKIGSQWQACTGGRISSASSGIFASPYGITSSGLAMLGGQIGLQELQTGRINHVIGLHLPQMNGMVWPATQTSGGVPGAPPMGLRLRLDPSISIDSLGLHPIARTIAHAAQSYGFIVWDSASTVGVSGEDAISLTARGLPNPYTSLANGASAHTIMAGFPWDGLQALPQSSTQSELIPKIHSFTASRATVASDTAVTLRWSASNVSRCAIPSLSDSLPANGTVVTARLQVSTTFILRCGGPKGTASSQLAITVTTTRSNDTQAQLDGELHLPYSGYANIITDLIPPEVAAKVYKVVYYEDKTYLYETATPPFALNTERMNNGRHTITARFYLRDGGSDQRTVGINVSNSPETLFAVTQSSLLKAPVSVPPWLSGIGLLVTGFAMYMGTRLGWRKAHLG